MLRIYRLLLYLYPASFRVEYGDQLWRDVGRRRRDVKGAAAAVGFWIAAIADIGNNASRVQWDVLRQDLHYTRRLFRRAPAFALTAIAVSALGIGATTATFSMADHVLLRPLPFHEPDRLVRVWEDQSFRGYPQLEVSPANFRDWQHMSHSFASLGAYADSAVNMLGQGSPERVASANVTANLFDTLGVSPALGRSFTADDDRAGAAGTVILSHRLWQSHFGGDPRVVGRTIVLNDERFAVIGVMRADFEFPSRETTLWVPFRWVANDFDARDNFWLYPIARLRNSTTLEDARAEMKVIAAQLERAYPKENERTSAGVYLLRDGVSDRARLLLMALAGGSVCILLIACINLASLLVARALSRQREFAVRCAIGAGRERLVRQMLTESVVLAGIGGMAGLALAAGAAPLIARLVPPTLPIAETPPLDARVLGIAFAATLLTGVGFGLVPALRMSRARMDALREGARSGTSRPTERLRSILVVAQVTATVVLLMTSGLLLRALWRVQSTDPGFRVEDVQTFRTALPFPRYEQTMRRAAFYRRVLGEVRHVPGVSQAAYISFLPMTMRGGIWAVLPEGAPANENAGPTASLRFVTPGFFDTMRISLRLGRDISEGDDAKAPHVAVVSESFVRRHWPGLDPIGRRFFFAFETRTVVGVVGDVRVRGLERTSEPQVYLSYQQVPDGWLVFFTPKDLVVRSRLAPDALVPEVRRIIAAADPEQPISDVQPLADVVTADTASRRVQARVLVAFALMAFLLAGIGVHGLLAFTVSARARELSVRIALGARPSDIVISVVRRAVLLSAAGVAAGVVAGLSAGRTLQALLAGIEPADPQTIAGVIVACGVVTVLGSAMPAMRAGRINPIEAMKTE